MTSTTIFALGITIGLIISFFREKYVKSQTAKQDVNFYLQGFAEASNYIISRADTKEERNKLQSDLETYLKNKFKGALK